MRSGEEERLYFKERPLRMEAALPLMASHWPPENLPYEGSRTPGWLHHRLDAASSSSRGHTDDTLRISASVLSFDDEQSSRQII